MTPRPDPCADRYSASAGGGSASSATDASAADASAAAAGGGYAVSAARGQGRATAWYAAAAVPGLLHAGASLYWALGGRWLLDTVGSGAVELGRDHPWWSAALLLPVALVKAAVALLPWLTARGVGRRPGWLHALFWLAGAVLLAYGVVYAAVAGLALGGDFGDLPDADTAGLWGHALLWDPLFAIWGALLLTALWHDRRAHRRLRGPAGSAEVRERRAG